jgi:hypothetical protein
MKAQWFVRSLTTFVLISALMLAIGAVVAADVTVPTGGSPQNVNTGSLTFDPTLTADTGSADGFVPSIAFNSGVLGSSYYTGVNLDHGMGEIIAGFDNVNGSAIDLTNGPANGGVGARTGIRASWSGRYLVNLQGDDFVFTDNGNAGGVEYVVVRAKPVGAAVSNFYYSPADAFQDSNGVDDGTAGAANDVGDFLTGVDLSDLGFQSCTTFEYIEIYEMLTTDLFATSGFGFVGGGTTPRLRPTTLDQIDTLFGGAISQFYDADIGFIFADSPGNLVNVPSPNLNLTTTDGTSGIVFTDACTQVTEGATVGDQFAFRLNAAPSSDVTVTFTVSSGTEIKIDNGFVAGFSFVNNFAVTFEGDNNEASKPDWNEWVVVNVQALFDSLDEIDPELHAVNISTSSSDVAFNALGESATVYVYDPGIVLSAPTPNPVAEGGTLTYAVTLNGPPGLRNATEGETVTINLVSYNAMLVTPTPTSLTFNRSDWNLANSAHTISVLAKDDAINYGVSYIQSINHTSSSNVVNPTYDSRYGGSGTNVPNIRQRFTILDNDLIVGSLLTPEEVDALILALWLDLAPMSGPVAEGTNQTALGVRLAGQPAEGEVVYVTLNTVSGVGISPVTLTFTAHNWDIYQPVNIAPALDAVAQGTYNIPVQVAVTDGTTMPEVMGAVNVVQIAVTDGAITGVIAEQPVTGLAPMTETTTGEGTSSE